MNFGFLGFGKMGSALVEGMLRTQFCTPDQIQVINRHPEALAANLQSGVRIANSSKHLVAESEVILLCTKPVDSIQLLRDVRSFLEGKLLVSVAAGINLERLQEAAGHRTRIIRAMPNAPSLIGQGATAFAMGDHATPQDADLADKIFGSVGITFRVREGLLDAVTGLSGSGPAYVFTFLEALTDGGVMMGLPRDMAFQLAIQTVQGSAQMLRQTGMHPAQLREMVTSPGGTTMAGLETLEERGFRYTLMSAIRSATERSKEL